MGITFIAPQGTYTAPAKLINKTITQNGTYNAVDDEANGYSEITVNVEGGGGGYDVVIKTTATKLSDVNTSNTVLEKGSWADIVDICRSGRIPSVYMYGYYYVDENEWYACQYNVSSIYADMGYNDLFKFYVTGGYIVDDSYKKGYMASSSGGSPTSTIYAPRDVKLIEISESGLTVSDL